MDDKVAYWASVALSALALLLLVTNVALVNGNARISTELNQRQVTINNAVGLSQINQALVQALADASVKENDKAIKDLLNSQGITVKPKSEAGATDENKE